MIDHGFLCAEVEQPVDAAEYTPRPFYRSVPAVEGVALMLSRLLVADRRDGPAHFWALRVGY